MNTTTQIIKYESKRKLLISSLDKIIFEYLVFIKTIKRRWFIKYIQKQPWLLLWINEKTPKLKDSKYNLETKLKWIFDDRDDFPICPTCKKYYGIDKVFKTFAKHNYQNHCSYKCSTLDPNVKKKLETTCIKLYNVRNGGGSNEAIKKIKQTKFERYGNENYCNVEKIKSIVGTKETNPEGWKKRLEHRSKTVGTKETNPEFWKALMDKSNATQIQKYGGIGYGSQVIKQKILESERKNHNGLLYVQTHEFAKKRRKRILYNGVYYDSSWEIIVVKFCEKYNIEYQYQPNITFEYFYNGNRYYYQPDFSINGNLYEVKGDQFFRINKETGKEEMFCPFRKKTDTDLTYEENCRKVNEKYKCMLKHNVIILRKFEIDNLEKIIKISDTSKLGV